jgi:hypothetical protein
MKEQRLLKIVSMGVEGDSTFRHLLMDLPHKELSGWLWLEPLL